MTPLARAEAAARLGAALATACAASGPLTREEGHDARRDTATANARDGAPPAQAEVVAAQIDRPDHYTAGGIETIDYLRAKLTPDELRGFLLGNALKYLSRAGRKGAALIDYRKARYYVEKLITMGEDRDETTSTGG